MKIESVDVSRFRCGYRTPITVVLKADSDLYGVGEAGVAYGVGGEATVSMIAELAGRFLIGQDAAHISRLWLDMLEGSFWGKGGDHITASAVSGLEQALWDLKGKALGAPVYELLGGLDSEEVPVYANGWWMGCQTPDEFAAAARRCVAEGHTGLKFYPIARPDAEVVVRHPRRRTVDQSTIRWATDCTAAIREAIGPSIQMMLDLGGGLSLDQLVPLCESLQEFDIEFIEEPVDPRTIDALSSVHDRVNVPIAAGERSHLRYGFMDLVATGALTILQPDVCNCGGVQEMRNISMLGHMHNLRVSPHNYGGPVATAVAAHVSATLPNLHSLEYFPHFSKEPDYVEFMQGGWTESERGNAIQPVAAPGFGIDVDLELLDRHCVRRVAR